MFYFQIRYSQRNHDVWRFLRRLSNSFGSWRAWIEIWHEFWIRARWWFSREKVRLTCKVCSNFCASCQSKKISEMLDYLTRKSPSCRGRIWHRGRTWRFWPAELCRLSQWQVKNWIVKIAGSISRYELINSIWFCKKRWLLLNFLVWQGHQ